MRKIIEYKINDQEIYIHAQVYNGEKVSETWTRKGKGVLDQIKFGRYISLFGVQQIRLLKKKERPEKEILEKIVSESNFKGKGVLFFLLNDGKYIFRGPVAEFQEKLIK